jgi:hypothetical protein
MKLKRCVSLFVLAFFSFSCTDDVIESRNYPVITTHAVTAAANGVTFNGEILDVGKNGVLDHGFLFSLSAGPTIDNSTRIELGEAPQKGTFAAAAGPFVPDNTYYSRAYAISNNGTIVYGQIVEFVIP